MNEQWRDTWAPMLCRTMLERSIYSDKDDIFRLLLDRGADPMTLPPSVLQIPVGNGCVEIARTLLALGVKPHDKNGIVRVGLESKNLAILDLLLSAGFEMNASNVPVYDLTDEITRFLVPKHLGPNDTVSIADEACEVEKLFGFFSWDQDGCEWAPGPLWMHFVMTGNRQMVEFMVANGADLSLRGKVWSSEGVEKSFTGLELARKRNDKRMVDLLKRAGAPSR